ncbi:MAG TPA: tetratricopeptide repeat protein [Burkholderiaceae bacterium]|jgi:predicted negative regulator of RcsB-dependent stress response|nr:tetratricopeptide repeat protein [Burkholderiaceae bacterium]
MAYDLEEQEQIDTIKAWWSKYGNLCTWVLIVVLAAYAGWTYWNNMQQTNVKNAGKLFDQMQLAITAKDNAKAQRAASDIQAQYGKTVYAEMSALTAAKAAYDADDLKEAKAQLQLVITNGNDDEYKAIAKVRLAGILLDEKSYDDGLKLLSGEFPAQFESMVADRKGDILVAQNKIPEARAAYQLALDKIDEKNPSRQLIQVKLDAIGGAVAKAAV